MSWVFLSYALETFPLKPEASDLWWWKNIWMFQLLGQVNLYLQKDSAHSTGMTSQNCASDPVQTQLIVVWIHNQQNVLLMYDCGWIQLCFFFFLLFFDFDKQILFKKLEQLNYSAYSAQVISR